MYFTENDRELMGDDPGPPGEKGISMDMSEYRGSVGVHIGCPKGISKVTSNDTVQQCKKDLINVELVLSIARMENAKHDVLFFRANDYIAMDKKEFESVLESLARIRDNLRSI